MLLQIPGGLELVIILLVMVLLFGIPLLLIGIVGAAYLRAENDEEEEDIAERIADLEAEIAGLRSDLEETSTDDQGGD